MTTRLSRSVAGAVAAFVTLSAAACGGDPNIDLPSGNDSTVVVTVTRGAEGQNQNQGQIDQSIIGGGSAAPSQIPGCNTDMDLGDTRFGVFGWTKKVLISQNGGATIRDNRAYHLKIAENQFDACQPLRWITLQGANGSLAQVAGTGVSVAQAVVFFLGDQLVMDPMPVEVHTVESVTRNGPDTLTVQYGVSTRTTAEGVTEHYTVQYAAQDGRLVEKSSTFPKDKHDQYMKLDFAAGPVPQDFERTPLGNAHTR